MLGQLINTVKDDNMQDPCSKVRKKIRAIAEIRYPAAPKLLDMRGKIIEEIHPEIQDYFKHWKTDIGTVTFSNNQEIQVGEFVISLKRTALIIEDIGSSQEFLDKTKKYFKLMYRVFGNEVERLTRVGVRFVEICTLPGENKFDDMLDRISSKFLNLPDDLAIQQTDNLVKVVHKNGFFQIGPVKKEEAWVKQVFADIDRNIPEAGVGLDIDSYSTDIEVTSEQQLLTAINAVFKVTKSVEESLLNHIGFING